MYTRITSSILTVEPKTNEETQAVSGYWVENLRIQKQKNENQQKFTFPSATALLTSTLFSSIVWWPSTLPARAAFISSSVAMVMKPEPRDTVTPSTCSMLMVHCTMLPYWLKWPIRVSFVVFSLSRLLRLILNFLSGDW